jgi:malate dehydrogenase
LLQISGVWWSFIAIHDRIAADVSNVRGCVSKLVLIGGAGNIGGSLAYLATTKGLFSEVVVFDIKESICAGKALDIIQCCGLLGTDVKLTGSSNYADLRGADAIVVTAGLARQPGMSRDDLLVKNASIITEVAQNIRTHAEGEPLVVVVTNPLDVMAWVMHKVTGFSKKKVIGMSGALDTSRFNYFLAQKLRVSSQSVASIILGSHGDTMVPLIDYTSVGGIPLTKLIEMKIITRAEIDTIAERARNGGAEIVGLLGSGSAYYAPATCVHHMLESYMNDRRMLITCCVMLEGEYGVKGLYAGVPIILGKNGVEQILELPLPAQDKAAFEASVAAVSKAVNSLKV